MKTPRTLTRVLLVLTVLSAGFLNYWAYSFEFYKTPGTYLDVVQGTAAAPEQYRVGVVYTAYFVTRHSPLQLRHAMALIDVVSGLLAGFLLLGLLEKSALYRTGSNAARWLASAGFLFLLAYYLIWLTWYQRPETLTTALLVACTLVLLSKRNASGGQQVLIVAGMLALSCAQALVRADVAFCMQAGIFLFCLTKAARGLSLPRFRQAALSAACVVLAGGVQYVLMHKVYPQASYGATPVVQLLHNVKDHLRIFPFAFFVVPWCYTVVRVCKKRFTRDAASAALLCGSAVFLVLWSILGKIDEVRIFMPFALALAPLTVQMVIQQAEETA